MQNLLDRPQPVRPGEELDLAALERYVKENVPGLSGPLSVLQFPKGYSNLTYLLRVGATELVLRRPPFGVKIKSAHDMGREYRILSRLYRVYSKVPRALAYCEDESVLGAPFYIMERVAGVVLRAQPPDELDLSPTFMRKLSESFIDNLADIHALDYRAAGLEDLGKPAGYAQRQVDGWIRRYQNARTDDIPEMEQVSRWLAEHMPLHDGAALIHNDYKYDNMALDPADLTRIVAVFDWEMATIGDPLMDLGSTLGYWVDADDPDDWQQERFGLTTMPGSLNREQLVERYASRTGNQVPDLVFYYVYALYKLGVIVQQIYARYKQGLTHDERFKDLNRRVYAGARVAVRAIDKQRICGLG